MEKNKWYMSSTGSGAVSLTLKGLIIGIVPAGIMVLGMAGVSFSEADLTQLIQQLSAIVASITVAYGLLRKLYVAWKKRKV